MVPLQTYGIKTLDLDYTMGPLLYRTRSLSFIYLSREKVQMAQYLAITVEHNFSHIIIAHLWEPPSKDNESSFVEH